jgi:hypothetical protein
VTQPLLRVAVAALILSQEEGKKAQNDEEKQTASPPASSLPISSEAGNSHLARLRSHGHATRRARDSPGHTHCVRHRHSRAAGAVRCTERRGGRGQRVEKCRKPPSKRAVSAHGHPRDGDLRTELLLCGCTRRPQASREVENDHVHHRSSSVVVPRICLYARLVRADI